MFSADEYYLATRDALLEAIGDLDDEHARFVTPEGVTFHVERKPPFRLYLLVLSRWTPGEKGRTTFAFQRNGRVNLGGNRKVPLRQAIAARHEPWASRQELLDLTAQIQSAAPAPRRGKAQAQ